MTQAQKVSDLLQHVVVANMKDLQVCQSLDAEIKAVLALSKRVVNQTQRRVLGGEAVPASEKLVSIFEPHTDIIVKDRRDTFYGHKVCLTSGASGLVLDLVVEKGNPADSTLATKVIARVAAVLGKPPKQATFDGGFSSKANVQSLKVMGVEDVAFSKHVGLEVSDMAKSVQAREGRVAPACRLVGFGNLRASVETASPSAIASPHRPTSYDVPPLPARKKWLVSLTLRGPADTCEKCLDSLTLPEVGNGR